MTKPATNTDGAEPFDWAAGVPPEPAPKPPKPISTGRPWTILGCTPHMERKVSETLNENGLRVYVPIEKYKPRSETVWRPRTRPLIPGYLFAEILDDAGLDLARANHAVRLMCRDGAPITVPALMIGTMIMMEAWGAFDGTLRTSGARKGRRRGRRGVSEESRWKHGQRVKVVEGPFASFFGTVTRADKADRLEVLISIFGRPTRINLDEAAIEEGED